MFRKTAVCSGLWCSAVTACGSPTQSPEELARWASRPWPRWPVGKGELTARGGELLTIQWREMRRMLAEEGLLPERGCPGPEDVLCVADAEQRTRESAAAIMRGLAPECGLPVASEPAEVTPLFHPVRAGQAGLDARAVRAELERTLAGLNIPPGALELIQRVTAAVRPACATEARAAALWRIFPTRWGSAGATSSWAEGWPWLPAWQKYFCWNTASGRSGTRAGEKWTPRR